ncbi:MAG TPA: ABC transporter permease [Lachnospiraceae bacterium]|nr:ABC transporter permease [Lachnospiraceae bacterium]
MKWKMLINDFKRNRAGNVALLLFMFLAAWLVVAATIVVTQLITSMTGMYQIAKPPHFLQMHKGEIEDDRINQFNSSYDGVTAWQNVAMIDVYGDNLTVYGDDEFRLSDCRLDISLVKQNKEYDLLLDEERKAIHVNKGEIGIPVILLDAYNINLGDTVVLTSNGITRDFKVTEFVHDAQMNSKLCSSTRLLISDSDFDELFGRAGEKEYLIEVYFEDSSMASDYQTAYENADLPQDGQAVTYTVIFLLSALADIVMSMVLVLVSTLLVLIALLCIKYTIMASLEEEIGEIGTMKAIGMMFKDIRNLYLEKYRLMVAAGILIGYILALTLSNIFTGHVSKTFGKQPVSFLTIGLPIVSCTLVYIITLHYCKRVLGKLRKVTVVDALVTGNGFGRKERVKDGVHRCKKTPINLLVSMREVRANFSGFIIIFIVMLIVSGMIIVPINLLNTMKSKEFISYMGSSLDDVRVEIDTGENLDTRYENMKNLLSKSQDINGYREYKRVRIETMNSEGEIMNLSIDCGVEAGNELRYLEGKAPSNINEIAVSKLNAEAMGKNVDDRITLKYNNVEMELIISGIYQDVTSGGYTAKAIDSFDGLEAQKYTFAINLIEGIEAKNITSIWSNQLGGGYDIEPMEEFIDQTLGGVTRQIQVATVAVVVTGVLLSIWITILFMKLRLAKDVAQIAAMKAIGFPNVDIRKQYLYKITMVSAVGIVAGTFFANVLGESMVSAAFRMMGIGLTRVTFILNPMLVFILIPGFLLVVTAGMTWICTKQIRKYNIITLINE